jgi:hypothetical protein
MKRNLIGILSLVVMSGMLNLAANAQVTSKAEVPFAFKMGSKQLRAGTYKVSAMSNSLGAKIQNSQTNESAMSVVLAKSSPNQASKLVFHRLAGQYFLSEIWSGGSIGMVIPTSREEKDLEKELRIASGQPNPAENVLIALN